MTVDLIHRGRTRYIAACILDCGGQIVILDPGPSSTLALLHRKLRDVGASISDVGNIMLTHIHLDHAGGVGDLVKENPQIRVFVHKLGASHLVDPTRLLESASQALGSDVEKFWGAVAPVPPRNIQTLNGGEEIVVGNRKFSVLYTPGHAKHHVSYFESATRIAFVGDTAGIRIGNAFVYPATPPPDVHLEQLDQSLDLLLACRPEQLFLTHFGLMDKADWHFVEFRERLQRWSKFVLSSLERPSSDSLRAAEFSEMVTAEIDSISEAGEAAWFGKLISPRSTWNGLAQYWRRTEK